MVDESVVRVTETRIEKGFPDGLREVVKVTLEGDDLRLLAEWELGREPILGKRFKVTIEDAPDEE